jgi:hypothetical protein
MHHGQEFEMRQVCDENSVDIYGLVSPEGEYVTMGKNLKARGEVSPLPPSPVDFLDQLITRIISVWLLKYRWRNDFLSTFLAPFTLSNLMS